MAERALDHGHPKRLRRALLAAGAAAACAPWLGACSADFEAPSRIDGVRVINVVADKPFANPGDTVTFTMTTDATGPYASVPLQILWIGGCFDPASDLYYACYSSFQTLIDAFMSGGDITQAGYLGVGTTFSMKLPDTIITDHTPDATGELFGLGYVFFAVCAGTLGPAPLDASAGAAGSFPLGCFDQNGNQLPAEAFVPGFTQVYSFADRRTNANPVAAGLEFKLDSADDSTYVPLPDSPTSGSAVAIAPCSLAEDERRVLGCGKDPYSECTPYRINILVDDSIAEIDPDPDQNGNLEHEAVWVDWYVSAGDVDTDVTLLYDPTSGLNPDVSIRFIPPPESGVVTLWAAVHDARGGGSVLAGYITVDDSAGTQ